GTRQRSLTDRILERVDLVPYGDPVDRLPHLVCFGVPGIEPQAVLLGLDRAGIAAHSGSACSSEALEPSPVLAAMGVDAHRSLRVSVGWSTTDAGVAAHWRRPRRARRPPCAASWPRTSCRGCRTATSAAHHRRARRAGRT